MSHTTVQHLPSQFKFIYGKLSKICEYTPWAVDDQQLLARFQHLIMDLQFLYMFCDCFKKYPWVDEHSSNRLRSTFNALSMLWAEEEKRYGLTTFLFFDPRIDTWPADVQAFHSLAFQLEVKIQRSKLLVQQVCEYFVCYSMQYKISFYIDMRWFLSVTREVLDSLSKLVPFSNQINILINKLASLDGFLENLEFCTDSKPKNFSGDFARKAMYLAFMYWAKEGDEEIATGMNIVFYDMLHKLIAYAPYVTILLSRNLGASFNSIVLSSTVARFVDFFFKLLDDDDFPILRDLLILLFTSLAANPFHQNAAAEEENVVRSQLHALFREHSYVLLSIGEVKEVFSDKKMLLRDFMTQIQIANAKIRQLHYGTYADSCICLEAEKMDYMYFVSVARELYLIEKHVKWADLVRCQLHLYMMELKFLRGFLLWFATWDDTDEEIRARLSSVITSLQGIWQNEEAQKGLLATRFCAIRRGDVDAADWDPLASELEGKIQLLKLEMEAWCVNVRHWSFQIKPSTSYKIVEFVDSILDILNDLVTFKAGEIVPFKKQIETLEEKLVLLQNFLKLTAKCIDNEEIRDFNMFVQAFVNDAAFLTFLYWAKDVNENIASEVDPMLSDMLQKINPVTPDIARLYFRTLEAMYLQHCDSLLFGQTASIFVDFFIKNLVTRFKDDLQVLHDEIIFLFTFLNDPLNKDAGDVIFSLMGNLFWEDVYGFLPVDDIAGDFDKKKKLLISAFILKIGTVNARIRRFYSVFPDSSSYNFPKVISPSLLDLIIQNLRNLKERMASDQNFVPFAKYKITNIVEELDSLCPFFIYIFDLKSERDEIWLEVSNLLHLIERTVNSCISSWFLFDHPIWYHMAYLCDLIDRIKVVQAKLKKMKENNICKECPPRLASFTSTASEPPQVTEIVVGFEDEVKKICDILTCHSESLDIVSIVGMGGLGKTTIAKKVFDCSEVQSTFIVRAFCYVSQDHDSTRLLLDILHEINRDDKRLSNMTHDDLAHQLWKWLSGRKYLIVLDDIWDVKVWNEVKSSFPNDKNGSKVMLTTRSPKVANECKIICDPYYLRFMSEAESWQLLQNKVFHNGIAPPYLYEIGRLIAENCKGLPLAVTVIAGLLARTEKNHTWWSEVAVNVVSYLDEGCMKFLELSYKHLPNNLKPCLLYLGAFPQNRMIRVKEVISIWIAEGFIQESTTENIEDVAKKYFHDLVDGGLIIVGERSSGGGIKNIRVHDLIHHLCQTKCRDMNFFHLDHGIASSCASYPSINEHYRVSMLNQRDYNIAERSSILNARSLLLFSTGIKEFPFREFGLVQVFNLKATLREYDMKQLGSQIHLRHLYAILFLFNSVSFPHSICNLSNIRSLTLIIDGVSLRLPEKFWGMKSLRHVKIDTCILEFPDDHECGTYLTLDKVISFSKPILSTGEDVQRLLQRLPAVQKLSCCLEQSPGNGKAAAVETLDFHGPIESLTLTQPVVERKYLINFPPTLKKLTLQHFKLIDISAVAKLHGLEVLKLRGISIQENRLEMEEDVAFPNLKFLEIIDFNLVEWNTSNESLPCLEKLVIDCPELEELPPCFEESPTLKKIVVKCTRRQQYPPKFESSLNRIWKEQMELADEFAVVLKFEFDD